MESSGKRPRPNFRPSPGDAGSERAMEEFLAGTGLFDPIDGAMRRDLPGIVRGAGARLPEDVEDLVEEAISKVFNTKDKTPRGRYRRFRVASESTDQEVDV